MSKHKTESRSKSIAFVIAILVVGYLSYSLYSENLRQASTIQSLLQDLSEKSNLIGSLTTNIENLNSDIDSLKSDLKSKELTINDLSNRLGITEGELQELTPIIKDYYALGVQGKNGVLIPLETKITKGTGVVSVNIKNIDLQTGAQDSIRTATIVAQEYTNVDLSKRDITVTFVNEQQGIVSLDGPSAGAAITLTIIAGVLNKTTNSKILITGTIELDGSVGPVGGIKEKGTAAASSGASVFLVPFGQKQDIGGIEVVEVKKIQEIVNLVLR